MSVRPRQRYVSCAEQSRLLLRMAEAHHLSGDWEGAKACARRARDTAQAAGRPYDEGLARCVADESEADRFVDVLYTPM
jgi:hypothetical protein